MFLPNANLIVSAFDHTHTHTHTHTQSVFSGDKRYAVPHMHGARLPLPFTYFKMMSHQFSLSWYSVHFNGNKCLLVMLLINIAWFKKRKKEEEVILDYRLASLSHNANTPNNRLRGVHNFWWQLGWKTWTPNWPYDLFDTFTFPKSTIPFLLCSFNFFSYTLHAF